MNLPVQIQPQPGESFVSWFARLCHANAATVRQVCRIVTPDVPPHELIREMTGSPPLPVVQKVAHATGISEQRLFETTTRNALGRRRASRLNSSNELMVSSSHIRYHGTSFCPQCLQESTSFLVAWRNSFTLICPIHERLMQSVCPKCRQVPLGLPWHPSSPRPGLEARVPVPGTCQASSGRGHVCAFPLEQSEPSTSLSPWAQWLELQVKVVLHNIGATCFVNDNEKSGWHLDHLVRELKRTPPSITDVLALVPEADAPEILNPYGEFLCNHRHDPRLSKRYTRRFSDPDRTIPRPEVMLVLSAVALKMFEIASPESPYPPLLVPAANKEAYYKSETYHRLGRIVSDPLAQLFANRLRYASRFLNKRNSSPPWWHHTYVRPWPKSASA